MSAICGVLALNNAPSRPDALRRMQDCLAIHGPDGSGEWHDQSVALGHQRMCITPQSTSETLPLHHASSGVALTADARLDNRDELLRALGAVPDRKVSDSSLVLSAYLKWGVACVEQFVGEFNIAIWDAGKRRLHCITDPMGIRPLYYIRPSDDYFLFASEISPLLNTAKAAAIDQRRIAMLGVSALTGFLETSRTCFQDIRRIPAATILTVCETGISSKEYWRPDPGKRLEFSSDAECAEAFREVFFDAVEARLRSTTPVAALLSGGLDSSAITGAASRIMARENRDLVTLSSLPEPDARGKVIDEEVFIEYFRSVSNIQIHPVRASGQGPFDDIEKLVETGALGAFGFQHYMYTALARNARKLGARLVLDGYGGELSASAYLRGYFSELLLRGRPGTLFRELRGLSADSRISMASFKRNVVRPLVPHRLLRIMNRHEKLHHMAQYPVREAFVEDVLGEDMDQIEDRILCLLSLAPDHRRNMAQSIILAQQDIRQRSHAGFLGYEEIRFSYPCLDKRVLEFGLAIDGRFKLENGQDRRLLRMASRGLMHESIRKRTSKAPFCPDYYLRYNKRIDTAIEAIAEMSGDAELNKVVDFRKIIKALEHLPVYNPDKPMSVDYNSQFLVPYGMFLCYFLRHFDNRNVSKNLL